MGKHKKGSKTGGRRHGSGKEQHCKAKRGQALARARVSKKNNTYVRQRRSKGEVALAKMRALNGKARARQRAKVANMWACRLPPVAKSYALIKAAWNSKDREVAAVAQSKARQRSGPGASRGCIARAVAGGMVNPPALAPVNWQAVALGVPRWLELTAGRGIRYTQPGVPLHGCLLAYAGADFASGLATRVRGDATAAHW